MIGRVVVRPDPAALAHHVMNERECLSEQAYEQMQDEVKRIVREAVEFAEKSEAPDVERELYSDVYANPQPGLSPIREYVEGAKNPLL